MSSLVVEPEHSIIRQSYQSKEREEPLNGDGFGVAWYVPHLSDEPAIFKDISPAWNNKNLLNLSKVVESSIILAHVRAATGGLPVTELNCHPFAWKQFSFMHNGLIAGFDKMRRNLRRSFSDEVYKIVIGSSDSEHAFGLFIDHYLNLMEFKKDHLQAMVDAIRRTICDLEVMRKETGTDEVSLLNFVVTDGHCIVVSRFASDACSNANTLYFYQGEYYICNNSVCSTESSKAQKPILVASEPLSDDVMWNSVPINQLLIVDLNRNIKLQPV